MSTTKRYCIQKLEVDDKKSHLKAWKNTKRCSDSVEPLKDFCVRGKHRIFDRTNGNVVYEP